MVLKTGHARVALVIVWLVSIQFLVSPFVLSQPSPMVLVISALVAPTLFLVVQTWGGVWGLRCGLTGRRWIGNRYFTLAQVGGVPFLIWPGFLDLLGAGSADESSMNVRRLIETWTGRKIP